MTPTPNRPTPPAHQPTAPAEAIPSITPTLSTTDSPNPTAADKRGRRGTVGVLLVALVAGGILLFGAPKPDPVVAPPGRVTAAVAWPRAQRADLPSALPDGTLFQPELFLDARTAIGTAPTVDGKALRLLRRDPGGRVHQLRRLPSSAAAQFGPFAVAGDDVVWAETTDRAGPQLWAVNLRDGRPARRLTADMGAAAFAGDQYDLVIAAGRVFWAASGGTGQTEIRSVTLSGGPIQVRIEHGEWSQTAWPWLTDELGRLLDTSTGRLVDVAIAGRETATCAPDWCRVMVLNQTGLERIDLMHPDGSARRRIAGGGALAAVTDPVVLDRFVVLAEPGPYADLTGTAPLLVYDAATGRTVDVASAAHGAATRNGVLWWSTGDETTIWHTLDLRTA